MSCLHLKMKRRRPQLTEFTCTDVRSWQAQSINNINFLADVHHSLQARLEAAEEKIEDQDCAEAKLEAELNKKERTINKKETEIIALEAKLNDKDREINDLRSKSARDLFSGVQQCPLCNENRKLTLLLPCLHTCCHTCAVAWNANSPGNEFKCFVCREKVLFTHDFETGRVTNWKAQEPESPLHGLWVPDGSELDEDLY